jgi:hypothetical protein
MEIRDDDDRVESLETVERGRTIYRVRVLAGVENSEPQFGWDLAGARQAVVAAQPAPPAQAVANVINVDITMAEMVLRADYPVYVFARSPSCTGWSKACSRQGGNERSTRPAPTQVRRLHGPRSRCFDAALALIDSGESVAGSDDG